MRINGFYRFFHCWPSSGLSLGVTPQNFSSWRLLHLSPSEHQANVRWLRKLKSVDCFPDQMSCQALGSPCSRTLAARRHFVHGGCFRKFCDTTLRGIFLSNHATGHAIHTHSSRSSHFVYSPIYKPPRTICKATYCTW